MERPHIVEYDQENVVNFLAFMIPLMIIFISMMIFEQYAILTIVLIILLELFIYVICAVCLFKCLEMCKQRRNREISTNELQVDINLNSKEILNLNEECMICLEILEKGIQLDCHHVYHRECIDKLLEYNIVTCPLCRADIA